MNWITEPEIIPKWTSNTKKNNKLKWTNKRKQFIYISSSPTPFTFNREDKNNNSTHTGLGTTENQ